MRDDQAAQMIEIMQGILDGVNALREDFMTFTAYGTENMTQLGDRITGGLNGVGGNDLGDISTSLSSIEDVVSAQEGHFLSFQSEFLQFTAHGTENMSYLADRITGGVSGIGGTDLDDIARAISSVESTIDLK